MHPLINAATVELIRKTGNTRENLPDRDELMEQYGLPYDRPAKNAIITGCQVLVGMAHVIKKLACILDRDEVSYTLLSKEYCCGNNIYRPAIQAKSDEAMEECRLLSKEFIGLNIQKAKALGAERLIVFCSPCYPLYKYTFPEENIIFYPQAIDEAISTLEWRDTIDYYAGCYKLHRKFAPIPMDLKSTLSVFSKIRGIEVNHIAAPDCCYKPDGLKHMIESVLTQYMVHICTGCYFQAKSNIPEEEKVKIMMLPEFIDMLQRE